MKREFRILILPILEARSIIFDASHTCIRLYVTWIEIYIYIEDISKAEVQNSLQMVDIQYIAIDECQVSGYILSIFF